MWVMTTDGYYSAVEHREFKGCVMVRARARIDLEALAALVAERDWDCGYPASPDIVDTPAPPADYPCRMVLPKSTWARYLAYSAQRIDYDNFKDAVKARQSAERAAIYGQVWWALQDLTPARRVPDVDCPKCGHPAGRHTWDGCLGRPLDHFCPCELDWHQITPAA